MLLRVAADASTFACEMLVVALKLLTFTLFRPYAARVAVMFRFM